MTDDSIVDLSCDGSSFEGTLPSKSCRIVGSGCISHDKNGQTIITGTVRQPKEMAGKIVEIIPEGCNGKLHFL
jgi:hypothetical protein